MTDDVGGRECDGAVPSALIFADSEAGGEAVSEAVIAAGGRIAALLGLQDAVERLNRQVAIDVVIVELSRDHGPLMDRLLDLLGYIAVRDNRPVVVAAPFALLDCVAARLSTGPITLLCEPDLFDRVSALSLAWGGLAALGVADISSDADSARLRRLAEEVNRIARTLVRLSNDKPTSPPGLGGPASRVADVQLRYSAQPLDAKAPTMPSAEDVRDVLRLRRMRNRFFDPTLFADPAWDMLLDLMAAQLEGEEVSVSSLSIAASVPSTTALRWIRTMTDLGLFERRADPTDGRRIYINLTEAAATALAGYFAVANARDGLMI